MRSFKCLMFSGEERILTKLKMRIYQLTGYFEVFLIDLILENIRSLGYNSKLFGIQETEK